MVGQALPPVRVSIPFTWGNLLEPQGNRYGKSDVEVVSIPFTWGNLLERFVLLLLAASCLGLNPLHMGEPTRTGNEHAGDSGYAKRLNPLHS